MSLRKAYIVLVAICLGYSFIWPVSAQAPAKFVLSDLNIATFPDMTAQVAVLNFSGAPFVDLASDRFEILEDGNPVVITNIEPIIAADQPVSIALVLDLSGSAPLSEVQTAAHQFLDHLGPGDQVALIGFNEPVNIGTIDPFKEVDFTSNIALVRDTIDGFSIEPQSAIYEAVHKALLNTARQTSERRAVLVMSDGYDTASRSHIADANKPRTTALDRRIPVFTVGVFSDDPDLGQDPDYLQVMAKETGGRYQAVDEPAELGEMFQNVVDQLRWQYRISFQTTAEPDGQDHRLTFRVRTVEGVESIEQIVRYPEPPPAPEIGGVKQGVEGDLMPLPGVFSEPVLLVPQIDSEIPLAIVQYQLDEADIALVALAPDTAGQFAPWEFRWDPQTSPQGSHRLTINAINEVGGVGSFSVDIEIGPLPTATVVEPGPTVTLPSERATAVSVAPVEASPVVGTIDQTTAAAETGQTPGTDRLIIIWAVIILLLILAAIILGLIIRRRQQMQLASAPPSPSYPALFEGDARKGAAADAAVDAGGVSGGGHSAGPHFSGTGARTTDVQSTGIFEPSNENDETNILAPTGDDEYDETVFLAPAKPLWGLLIRQDDTAEIYELRKLVTTLGRTRENDVVLKDSAVSRQHAEIRYEAGALKIYNLSRTNLTKVNDQEVDEYILQDQDRIEIGRVVLLFKVNDE